MSKSLSFMFHNLFSTRLIVKSKMEFLTSSGILVLNAILLKDYHPDIQTPIHFMIKF